VKNGCANHTKYGDLERDQLKKGLESGGGISGRKNIYQNKGRRRKKQPKKPPSPLHRVVWGGKGDEHPSGRATETESQEKLT